MVVLTFPMNMDDFLKCFDHLPVFLINSFHNCYINCYFFFFSFFTASLWYKQFV